MFQGNYSTVCYDLEDSEKGHSLIEIRCKQLNSLPSNCTRDGVTLSVTYNKPFSIIAEGIQTQEWRPQSHSPQTFVEFEFEVIMVYWTKNGSRWQVIEYE